jgi:hypothetical protein
MPQRARYSRDKFPPAAPSVDRRRVRGAKRTCVDGVWFPSGREAKRWSVLKLCERAGEIFELRRQVPFTLDTHADGQLVNVGKYVADFVYREKHLKGLPPAHGIIVEDAKGFATDLYRWKIRHLRAQYGIVVREV